MRIVCFLCSSKAELKIISDSLIILQLAGVKEVMLQQQNDNKGSIDVDKINENIANAIRGLINTMENGLFSLFNGKIIFN